MSVSWLYNWFLCFFSVAGDESTTRLTWVISPARGVVEPPDPWPLLNPHWLHAPAREPRSPGSLVSHLPFFLWPWRGNSTVTDRPMLRRNCLLLFLCFPLWAELLRSLPKQARARLAPQPDGAIGGRKEWRFRGFQRVKRGWVWNQFLCLRSTWARTHSMLER